MNTAIQTFLSPAGKDIRAMVIDGEPWFVGKDVATALGYIEVGRAIRQHCDDGGAKRTPLQTAGGLQEVRLINEGDVYSLIFGSRLPEAKAESDGGSGEGESGIRFEVDAAAARVKLYFPDKPDEQTRAGLKAHGFRWSPRNKAWQAYVNYRTIRYAKEVAGIKED